METSVQSKGRSILSRTISALQPTLTLVISMLSVLILFYASRLSNQANELALLQTRFEQDTSRRRLVLDTLKDMQVIQSELQTVQSRVAGSDNLTEKEILLLNYYEILSKTLADNINKEPNLLAKARCIHPDSVRLRKKPSGLSEQIGGVAKDDLVTVLGTFTRGEEHKWYYVVTSDNKIGWGYKYFEVLQ